MANKKDLRGSIEKMREVAQLLSEWASDLEQTVSDALQVARSSETSELPSGESRRLSLRNCDMEASPAKKSRKSTDAAAEPVVTETPAAHPEAVPPESAAPPRQLVAADVRALLAEKCAAGFRAQVQALINSYGAAKFSEVDPSHYAELMESAASWGEPLSTASGGNLERGEVTRNERSVRGTVATIEGAGPEVDPDAG